MENNDGDETLYGPVQLRAHLMNDCPIFLEKIKEDNIALDDFEDDQDVI